MGLRPGLTSLPGIPGPETDMRSTVHFYDIMEQPPLTIRITALIQ
jgi:hypothetical protein